MEPFVSAYLADCSKGLQADRKTKEKLLADLSERLNRACREHKTEEEIRREFGNPREIAQKFNEAYRQSPAYKARRRRRTAAIFTAVAGALSAVHLAVHIVVDKMLYGDVDLSKGPVALVFSKGPLTATYVIGSAGNFALFFGVWFLVLLLIFLLLRHSTKRYFPAYLT